MIAALVLLVCLQQVQAPPPSPSPGAVVTHRIRVLREWARAVEQHTPGEVDTAGLMVARLSQADLHYLWIDIRALVAVIRNPWVSSFVIRPEEPNGRFDRIYTTRDDREALLELAGDIQSRIGASQFYKRAAVLHSDVVMRVRDAPVMTPIVSPSIGPTSPYVHAVDGQQTGLHGGDLHWEFGRMLLGDVREAPRDDTVRAWYRATMSYKLAHREWDTPHFDQGRRLFPDDAEVQFLFGALHEGLSNPRIQVAREAVLPTGIRLDVQPERAALEDANRYYSRALQLDPGHVEARVRHGRVLSRLGRHQEAAAELGRALDTSRDDRLMTYYAHMFAGATEEALHRFDAARVAYERAAALYPRAQAPVIALSQLLHRTGDRQAAHAGLRDVLQPAGTKSEQDDPWWNYHSGAGRFTDERVAALYRSLSGAPAKP